MDSTRVLDRVRVWGPYYVIVYSNNREPVLDEGGICVYVDLTVATEDLAAYRAAYPSRMVELARMQLLSHPAW